MLIDADAIIHSYRLMLCVDCSSRVTLLVIVFTMIELFTDEAISPIIKSARLQMQSGVYDASSAMLWMYFLVVAAIMGIVLFLYSRMLMRRWE